MKQKQSSNIISLVSRVNRNMTGIFKRESELIVILPHNISRVIGSCKIYLSEFIIAKVKGKIKDRDGHPEITDQIFLKIPKNLSFPREILKDTRHDKKYLFINIDPFHEIVVEISRNNLGKSEINTIHIIDERELKRLEHKFPVVYSSGETPNFSHTCL